MKKLDRSQDRPLPSVKSAHGTVVKRVIQIVKGSKVILLKLDEPVALDQRSSPLIQLALGDPSVYSGKGYILEEESEWSRVGREPTTNFNCHSYSLGDRVGMTPFDWVEGEPTDLSMNTNPMEILVKAYFKPIKIIDVVDVNSLTEEVSLLEGDLISFTCHRPYWGIVHAHSGLIKRVGDKNWLTHKVQRGRLVVTPINEFLPLYPLVDKVRVYRFRV